MITLEEYKNHLIGVYRYPIDNTKAKIVNRKDILGKTIKDDKLQSIIDDTYDFIKDVLNSDTLEYDYCKIELEDDTTSYISLNLVGGYFSDKLFTDSKGRTISSYIMQYVLGEYLTIGIDEEAYEREDDDIIYYDYRYYLYMQGFPNNLDEIKDNLFNNKELIKSTNKH